MMNNEITLPYAVIDWSTMKASSCMRDSAFLLIKKESGAAISLTHSIVLAEARSHPEKSI